MSDLEEDGEARIYAAPAAERALSILEYLAEASRPVSQSQIAQTVGLTVAQIYRVLNVLVRRGYVARDNANGLYSLTMRLYEIAHVQEPMASLRRISEPPMRSLSRAIEQSCNLGYRVGDKIVIVAEAESPSSFGFRVRVGASFPLLGTASGELMLALESGPEVTGDAALARRLELMRRDGHAEQEDSLHPGITDVAYPILRPDGSAIAVLTVPYVATSYSSARLDGVRSGLAAATREINALLSGVVAPTL